MMQKILTLLLTLLLVVVVTKKSRAQINQSYVYYISQELIVDEKYNSAIDVLNVLLRAAGNSSDGYFLRGVAKYNLGDYIGAEQDFTSAIEINNVFTRAYQYRAIARSLLGNYNDSLEDFAMAIDIRPDQEGLYYSRGVTYFLSQQFKEAIEDFNHFLRRMPHSVDAYVNRGTSYLMLKDSVNAFNDFDRAVKTNIYDPQGYLRRGSFYFKQKEFDKADEDLSRAIHLDTLNLPAYFNRALVYAETNQPTRAIKDFDKVVEIDSTSSITYFNRALLLSQIGDYNRAMEDYNMVESLSPQNVLVYFNRGLLNNQLGNIYEAENDFTKAISLYPDFANAYINRSNVRQRMGRMGDSKRDYDIAQQKIKEYQARTTRDEFSTYADTSKVFNSLLSFDVDFGNRDFKTKASGITTEPISMSRFTAAKSVDNFGASDIYENSSVVSEESKLAKYSLRLTTRENQLSESEIKSTIQQVDSLIALGKEDAELYFVRGALDHAERQFSNAIKNYSRAIEIDPNNMFYYLNRAVAHTEMTEFIMKMEGQAQRLVIDAEGADQLKNRTRKYSFDPSYVDLNSAARIDSDVAQIYYIRGYILALNEDYARAIENYSRAIELYPQMREAYFNRGLIQIKLGENQQGFWDLSRAGELGDKNAYQIIKEYGKLLKE